MSDEIKTSIDKLQMEYNRVVAELGHSSAQIAVKIEEIDELKKQEKDATSRIQTIVRKVKSLQANLPKEEIKQTEENQNGQA